MKVGCRLGGLRPASSARALDVSMPEICVASEDDRYDFGLSPDEAEGVPYPRRYWHL